MPRLAITATQGSADAFVEASAVTALSGQTRTAYNVLSITLQSPGTVANSDWEVALSRRTKTAVPAVSDVDVIRRWARQSILTTSGAYVYDRVAVEYPPDRSILIVEDPIYLQLDSSGTSAANTAIVVIEYELVTLSEVDRLSILVQSLT